jgi:hypothetical protein
VQPSGRCSGAVHSGYSGSAPEGSEGHQGVMIYQIQADVIEARKPALMKELSALAAISA